jgi:hypothetical protein
MGAIRGYFLSEIPRFYLSAPFFSGKFGVSPILQIHPNDYSISPTQQRGLPMVEEVVLAALNW